MNDVEWYDVNMIEVEYFTYTRNDYAKSYKSADSHVMRVSIIRFTGFRVVHSLFFSLH